MSRWTKMRRAGLVSLAGLVCAGSAAARAGDERWVAYSRTAIAITGDILLSPARLHAAGVDFPLRRVADLPRYVSDQGPVPARVLAVTRAMDPKLLGGNRLGCGRGRPARWIVVWRSDKGAGLGVDVFGGRGMPRSVDEAGLCGTYSYSRTR